MAEIIQALIKRSSVFIIVAGLILLVIAAAGGIVIGSFSVALVNPVLQWLIIIVSILLVGIGIFLEVKNGSITKAGRANNVKAEISQAKVYTTRADSYVAFLDMLNGAKESIDIISYHNLRAADAKRNQFYDALRNAIESRHVSHQRIVWNLDQLQWLEKILDMGWDNFAEFSVKFYEVNPLENPLTTFGLIDQQGVFLGQGWLVEGHLEIKGQEIGHFFRGYFAGIWNKSEWIKERGKPANRKRIKELTQDLKKYGKAN